MKYYGANEVYDLVTTLVGDIKPIGDTQADDKRFDNLKVICGVVDKLLYDIDAVIPNKNRAEHSMKRAGEYADEFMSKIGIEE